MKHYLYLRVSSEAQDYEQQHHCIYEYFARNGISPGIISETVVEKVSGTVNHKDRKLSKLIDKCESGDVIYISELSRLGRNMSDLFALVNELCDKGREEAEVEYKKTKKMPPYGVTIIQCKDNSKIENNSISGKALLFALGLAAEIEVANIRQRTRMGLAARLDERDRNGYWISNSGNVCTHLGNDKGCDMGKAVEAASELSMQKKKRWKEQSVAYQEVRDLIVDGKTNGEILEEIQKRAKRQPDVYCTRTGKPITLTTIWKWKQDILEEIRLEDMA